MTFGVAVAVIVFTWLLLPYLLNQCRWPHRLPHIALVFTGLNIVFGAYGVIALCADFAFGTSHINPLIVHAASAIRISLQGKKGLSPGLLAVTGITLGFDFTMSLVVTWVLAWWTARQRRRRHLAILGVLNGKEKISVLDSPQFVAYSVPGRKGRIVLSSALANALTPDERQAIIRHEEAHLGFVSAQMSIVSSAVRRWERVLPIAGVVASQIDELLELCADDRARHAGLGIELHNVLRLMERHGSVQPRLAGVNKLLTARATRCTSHAMRFDRFWAYISVAAGMLYLMPRLY